MLRFLVNSILACFFILCSYPSCYVTRIIMSISFISASEIPTKVEDVSSVISIGVLRSTDRCVSIRDCCAGDRNSDCCVPLIDCCASGTDNDWFFLRTFSFYVFTIAAMLPESKCLFKVMFSNCYVFRLMESHNH